MDWGWRRGTFQTNQRIPWQLRILRNKEIMVGYRSMLSLLFICLPLISSPVLAKLAGTQSPFSKTMKHKRLWRLCFESTGFSSDWVAANYPPCNYGDPRSKQMGKSFVFKWRRNQYVGRKGSLFIWTDSRWLVAKSQRAGEPGLALDQSGCTQTRGASEATGSALTHPTGLPAASVAGRVEAKAEVLAVQASDLDAAGTSSPAILLSFNSNMLVCFIREENSRKDMQKPKPYGRPPGKPLVIWSFTKPRRYFPFLKDHIVINFLLDSASWGYHS